MADINFNQLTEKLTDAVSWDQMLIQDSEDLEIIKRIEAVKFKWPQGEKGATWDKGDKWDKGDTWATWPTWPQWVPWLDWKWEYNSVVAYLEWDWVSYNWSSYIAIQSTTWNLPTDIIYWNLLAEKGESGTWTGDMLASVYDPQNKASDAFNMWNFDETNDKKVMTADERTQINTSRSSYVISSSVSINAWDNTKFDFSATWVVKEGNTIYPINISQAAISPTFLATEKVTFILVDKNGNLVQQSSPATSAQIKTHLAEWVIVHSNNTNVNAVNNNSLNWDNELNQFQAYARNFWYVNLNGNRYSANWTNLEIDKSAGRVMFPWLGQNNEKEQIAQTALSFRIRNQDGSETTDITDLDVVNYDNGWVTTAIPWATNSVWAVYRVYLFADSNITRLARPQFYYNTKEEAQLSFRNENFILEKNLNDNGMLAGYILFRKNTTNLSDIDNEFISAEGSGSFGWTSFIPTLQASYNVSPQPQIITDNWSVQLQGGETNTDDVLEIKDTWGTTTATIQANGVPTKGTDLVRKTELDTKQETLVSWTNIKTVNWEDVLWGGNIVIETGWPSTSSEFVCGENISAGDTIRFWVNLIFPYTNDSMWWSPDNTNQFIWSSWTPGEEWQNFRNDNYDWDIQSMTLECFSVSTSQTINFEIRDTDNITILATWTATTLPWQGYVPITWSNNPVLLKWNNYRIYFSASWTTNTFAYYNNDNLYPNWWSSLGVNNFNFTWSGNEYDTDEDINKIYKIDAVDTDKLYFIGFVKSSGILDDTIWVDTSGINSNQTGLTISSDYYLSDIPGAISTTPWTNSVLVGRAISETDILINTGWF